MAHMNSSAPPQAFVWLPRASFRIVLSQGACGAQAYCAIGPWMTYWFLVGNKGFRV